MGVEVHEPEAAVAPGQRAQHGQRHGVIAAHAERHRPRLHHRASVRSMAVKVASMETGTASTSPQSATRRRSKGCTRRAEFQGRISEDCSRTCRGPIRAPERYEQPPSKGIAEQGDVEARRRFDQRQPHEGRGLGEARRREAVAGPRISREAP